MIEARVTFANEEDYAWFLEIMQEAYDAGDLALPFRIKKVYPPGGLNITRRAGLFGEVIDDDVDVVS
jgi:hypothetical protein|tara:strand:+ start:2768 stop:2968 length:201 start_codon:yes stop_codon:yes gene_type:complete